MIARTASLFVLGPAICVGLGLLFGTRGSDLLWQLANGLFIAAVAATTVWVKHSRRSR